jgi:alpha-beta hydrolase superfamily lysophospholipase
VAKTHHNNSPFMHIRIVLLMVGLVGLATSLSLSSCSSGSSSKSQTEGRPESVRESTSDRKVIVFMHGVLGDGKSTWTNTATGAYWPDLLAHDHSFDGYDIFVFAYPSPYLGKSYSIDELADNLRLYIDSKEFPKKYDEIIFLCHSMGGARYTRLSSEI